MLAARGSWAGSGRRPPALAAGTDGCRDFFRIAAAAARFALERPLGIRRRAAPPGSRSLAAYRASTEYGPSGGNGTMVSGTREGRGRFPGRIGNRPPHVDPPQAVGRSALESASAAGSGRMQVRHERSGSCRRRPMRPRPGPAFPPLQRWRHRASPPRPCAACGMCARRALPRARAPAGLPRAGPMRCRRLRGRAGG